MQEYTSCAGGQPSANVGVPLKAFGDQRLECPGRRLERSRLEPLGDPPRKRSSLAVLRRVENRVQASGHFAVDDELQ